MDLSKMREYPGSSVIDRRRNVPVPMDFSWPELPQLGVASIQDRTKQQLLKAPTPAQMPSPQIPQMRGLTQQQTTPVQRQGMFDGKADALQMSLLPLTRGGQFGSGNPQHDLDMAAVVRMGGGGGGRTGSVGVVPSPTGGSYAGLMGRYGPLIDPPKGPSDLRLQAQAAQSLAGILPFGAILPGSYRTNAQQAALYAKDSHRYAPPGKSLHEYGLAIDVSSTYLAAHPEVRRQLIARGWYQERPDEPWHFSYGFFSPVPGGSGGGGGQGGRSGTGRTRPRPPRQGNRTLANTGRQRL